MPKCGTHTPLPGLRTRFAKMASAIQPIVAEPGYRFPRPDQAFRCVRCRPIRGRGCLLGVRRRIGARGPGIGLVLFACGHWCAVREGAHRGALPDPTAPIAQRMRSGSRSPFGEQLGLRAGSQSAPPQAPTTRRLASLSSCRSAQSRPIRLQTTEGPRRSRFQAPCRRRRDTLGVQRT